MIVKFTKKDLVEFRVTISWVSDDIYRAYIYFRRGESKRREKKDGKSFDEVYKWGIDFINNLES